MVVSSTLKVHFLAISSLLYMAINQGVFVAFSRAFAKLVELGCVRLQSRGVAQRVQNTLCTLFEVLVVFVPLGVVTLLCLICLICLIPLCVIF